VKLAVPGEPHLTYCTNIHPGESWAEVRANLERHVTRAKAAVAPSRPFGVGLRLSAAAAATLVRPAELEAFRAFLHDHGFYVFTINGFPYGPFHGTRVKEEVYLPDWLDDERLAYSDRLAELLAALLPADAGLEGTVSTVPGAFKGRVRGEADEERLLRGFTFLSYKPILHLVNVEEAAIAEGATLVRIGTAIFGPREK